MAMVRSLAFVAVALVVPAAASAQDWPGKQPIKIVVPFTAGSATDITARTVFEQVGRQIGQTFIVENRGGAGTTLGMTQAAKSDPDGYTMLVHSTSHVVVASTYPNLPFNVADDFAVVSALADVPFVIAAATKHKTLMDMIDAGKAPGALIYYGSAGAGSSGHLFMERFRIAAGFPATLARALRPLMRSRWCRTPAATSNCRMSSRISATSINCWLSGSGEAGPRLGQS
jgi:tripartite-type tricarboxylate transporter receptor subunit TctC